MINKGKLLKTAGWLTVGAGLILVTVGSMYDEEQPSKETDDNIIDAEWYEVKD